MDSIRNRSIGNLIAQDQLMDSIYRLTSNPRSCLQFLFQGNSFSWTGLLSRRVSQIALDVIVSLLVIAPLVALGASIAMASMTEPKPLRHRCSRIDSINPKTFEELMNIIENLLPKIEQYSDNSRGPFFLDPIQGQDIAKVWTISVSENSEMLITSEGRSTEQALNQQAIAMMMPVLSANDPQVANLIQANFMPLHEAPAPDEGINEPDQHQPTTVDECMVAMLKYNCEQLEKIRPRLLGLNQKLSAAIQEKDKRFTAEIKFSSNERAERSFELRIGEVKEHNQSK